MSKKFVWTASALALAVSSAFAQSTPEVSQQGGYRHQLANLDPVVVTASRFEELRSNASAVVDVIGREDIERSGASNVSEYLDQVPGVTLSRLYGRQGVDASVDIGYLGESGSQNVLILVDGQRLNPFDQSSVNFLQVPISGIERIEIRKASGGVLFGDRAQGGVVNIITRTDSRREASVSAGSFAYKKADTFVGFSSGMLFGSISGLVAESSGYRDFNKSSQNAGRFSLGARTDLGTLSVAWSGFDEKLQLPGSLTEEQFVRNPRQAASDFSSVIDSKRSGSLYSARYEYPTGDSGLLSIDMSQLKTDQVSTTTYRDYPAWGSTKRVIENIRQTLQPELKRTLGSVTFIVGTEVSSSESNTEGDKQVSQTGYGVYAQGSHRFPMGHTVDLGIRNHEVRNQFRVAADSPVTESKNRAGAYTIGTRLMISDGLLVRIGYANGFRFANADELYYYNNVVGSPARYTPVSVNPTVKPMQSDEFYSELSFRQKDFEHGLHWRYIETKNEIGSADNCGEVSGVIVGCNTNLFDTKRHIVTFFSRAQLMPSLLADASLDLISADIDSGLNKGRRIPVTPTRVLKAGVKYSLDGRRHLLARVNHRDSMVPALAYGGSANHIPSRTVYEIGMQSSERRGLGWSVWFRNLFNKSYYDYAADSFGIYGVYPADKRSVELNARYLF